MSCRNLILILGDQLDQNSPVIINADKSQDKILMIESRQESTRIPSHKARTALFLAAMRHHAKWLQAQGFPVDYFYIGQTESASFETALLTALSKHNPTALISVEAGEYHITLLLKKLCEQTATQYESVKDSHFFCSIEEFSSWSSGRKSLVMETFYRNMRKHHDIIMQGKEPVGGHWNYDKKNRGSFGKKGPGLLPELPDFKQDEITKQVLVDVEKFFPDNPGELSSFNWPVKREQSLVLLNHFIEQCLVAFGQYQDAMWENESLLYHSALSASLNLKMISPREVIDRVLQAYQQSQIPLSSVEGFIRQILGWREYIRGVYWTHMPDYLELNYLKADQQLPDFYWTAETEMRCLQQVIGQTLQTGYAHHIQRLMVTGLFALLLGVRPRLVHEWYLSVYVDAVEWVELPNTLGMSQFADGGILGSKPYVASGRYIQRMSNYCDQCCYDPAMRIGNKACPFTTLYWDFLIRHKDKFAKHPRSAMQWRMLEKLDDTEKHSVVLQADKIRNKLASKN